MNLWKHYFLDSTLRAGGSTFPYCTLGPPPGGWDTATSLCPLNRAGEGTFPYCTLSPPPGGCNTTTSLCPLNHCQPLHLNMPLGFIAHFVISKPRMSGTGNQKVLYCYFISIKIASVLFLCKH